MTDYRQVDVERRCNEIIQFLKDRGGWVSTSDVKDSLGIPSHLVSKAMDKLMAGDLPFVQCNKFMFKTRFAAIHGYKLIRDGIFQNPAIEKNKKPTFSVSNFGNTKLGRMMGYFDGERPLLGTIPRVINDTMVNGSGLSNHRKVSIGISSIYSESF